MKQERIVINGGRRLQGRISVCGAKNSVLKLMAASIMAPGISTITNVPDISDVDVMRKVLETLGAEVGREGRCLTIDASNIRQWDTPYELVVEMRASIAVLGPLIGRFGRAHVAMPGGCKIGSRKLDMHLAGLQALGVQFDVSHGYINASLGPAGLSGAEVELEFASVGATENLMMAAVCANGTTVIDNAAREPEIVDLADFLVAMGANISGQGTPSIRISGPADLQPVQGYATVGDRIEAGTYLVAGALGQGPVTVQGINPEHLAQPLRKLKVMGCELEQDDDSITVRHRGGFKAADIQTLPFPGFPTDLQPQFTVLAALADGTSVITENVFENRFMFADELSRMGANIRIEGHQAIVEGIRQLSGAPVLSPDLRAGAGLILAGLVADGQTSVGALEHIDRGYEDIVGKLAALGADIERQ